MTMFEKAPGPRHRVTELPDGVALRIPSRRNLFLFAFLTFWLCGWLVGEIMVSVALFAAAKKQEPPATFFMLAWLGAWTVGGAFAIYTWLWQLAGFELVTASGTALSVKRAIFGFGSTKHYDATKIRDLRVATTSMNPFDFRSSLAFWGIGGGTVSFDYGYKSIRFAAGVEEAEARIIRQLVAARLPSSAVGTAP
jgi:hypothetical protein